MKSTELRRLYFEDKQVHLGMLHFGVAVVQDGKPIVGKVLVVED